MYIPTEEGYFVSERHQILAEVIHDYDPYLELRWIPPAHRSTPDDITKCYAVIDTRTNTYVLYAGELDTPESILARIFNADNKHGSVLDRIDAQNNAAELLKMKQEMVDWEEAHDIAQHFMQSPKNYIKHRTSTGELVKLDDQRRRVE